MSHIQLSGRVSDMPDFAGWALHQREIHDLILPERWVLHEQLGDGLVSRNRRACIP